MIGAFWMGCTPSPTRPTVTDPDAVVHSAVSPPHHTGIVPPESPTWPWIETGLPEPIYEGVFADCPRFDYLLPLTAAISGVDQVFTLDDGDLLVAGRFAGQPVVSTDRVRLTGGLGSLNAFVARLHPDGTHVWSHSFTGGQDGLLGGVSLTERGLWVAGSYGGGPLRIDGVEIGGVNQTALSAFALRFSRDGVLQRSLWVTGDLSTEAAAVVEDADDNVYLLGEFNGSRIDIGALSVPRVNLDIPSLLEDLFLASFDAQDQPRWLTTLGMRYADVPAAPSITPHTMAFVGSKLLVSTGMFPTASPTTVQTHRGDSVDLDLGPISINDTLVPFDPATGIPEATGFTLGRNWTTSLTDLGNGTARIAGDVYAPTAWTDAGGVEHPLVHPYYDRSRLPFVAEVDERGTILSVDVPYPEINLLDGFFRDATRTWVSGGDGPQSVRGAGTEREWSTPDGTSAVAIEYDAGGAFRCGVAMEGGYPRVYDITIDGEGGVVLVGAYRDELTLSTTFGVVAHRSGNGTDNGFIARFTPAPPQ